MSVAAMQKRLEPVSLRRFGSLPRGRKPRSSKQQGTNSMSLSRKELTFASGHDTCAAWFYPAAADEGARPIIVMAHGLTGTRRDRLGAFAERFAAAGIAAFVFDYRGFGDSTGEPDLFEPSLQLEDWRAAIAFSRSLPDIDAGRVATFGSSLGATRSPRQQGTLRWLRLSARFHISTETARLTANLSTSWSK
jgi:pimeloyl-ACP methyl ester carboxylesterase